ncbi:Homocitrate synthase [Metarhizium album ARSEF 1941]|uniref:Homocitrate synthase n=1 Tax=Metarhizium album (strain ARSEF 1941) TaxID=1081103 RepID=A0A0B2WKM7_METAS|nr:Homocitrate synthase [Metarhizium album ARSEF 1941]KHN94493.1 Homocitrate synthase [Metarhizium album ARSEF 1941]
MILTDDWQQHRQIHQMANIRPLATDDTDSIIRSYHLELQQQQRAWREIHATDACQKRFFGMTSWVDKRWYAGLTFLNIREAFFGYAHIGVTGFG